MLAKNDLSRVQSSPVQSYKHKKLEFVWIRRNLDTDWSTSLIYKADQKIKMGFLKKIFYGLDYDMSML
jgi:hypothetical protein